jgi:hypothetical protein
VPEQQNFVLRSFSAFWILAHHAERDGYFERRNARHMLGHFAACRRSVQERGGLESDDNSTS